MKVTLGYGSPSNATWKVKGSDAETLFKNLNKHKWWGRYRSNSKGTWTGKGAKISSVKIAGKPVITMPVWTEYSKVKAGQKSWDKMWAALKKHEDEHHVIFDTAAQDFKKMLEKGGDLDPKDMQKAWDKFVKDTQKKQDAFDSKTGHGSKTGVVLDMW
jgi:predicted secreted Zn-dependent protease